MNYQFFAPASLLYKLLHRLCAVVLIRPFPCYLCLPNTPLSNLDLAVAFDRFAQQLRLSPPRIASRLSPSLTLSFNLSAFASQLPDHLLHRSIQGARACSSRLVCRRFCFCQIHCSPALAPTVVLLVHRMLFLSLSSQYFHRLTSAFVDSFTPSALPSPSLASSPSFSAACALLRLLASAFVVPVAPAGTFVLRMLHGSHSSFLLRLLTFALGNALVYPLSANLQLLCRSPTIVSALPCSPPVIVLAVRSFHQFLRHFRAGSAPHSALLPTRGDWC